MGISDITLDMAYFMIYVLRDVIDLILAGLIVLSVVDGLIMAATRMLRR